MWHKDLNANGTEVPLSCNIKLGMGNLLFTGKAQNYNWKFMKRTVTVQPSVKFEDF